MIAIVHEGIAWCVLGKAGNSHTEERKALLERFPRIVPARQIAGPPRRRRVHRPGLIGYLVEREVPFYIRIRKNMRIGSRKGRTRTAASYFAGLPVG